MDFSHFLDEIRTNPIVRQLLTALGLLLICVLANALTRRILLRLLHKVVRRTKVTWDDKMFARGVFTRLSHLVPGFILYHGAFLFEVPGFVEWLQRLALAYIVLCVAWSLHALLNAFQDIYRGLTISVSRPITGYVQSVQLLLWIAAAIYVVATLLNRSPSGFLTGLGALSAILMLVFRDSILGLVAGIQITANDMVRIGDWIEMPKFGADGDVIDISLHTVKVRNWDNTITTVPSHALIQDSFKNWRGMSESGGRRIKRALYIDLQTVRFCDDELRERLGRISLLRPHLESRGAEIESWNAEHDVDPACLVNGRRLTNLGCFRAYIIAYLRSNPGIQQEGFTFLIRQLAPTETGLPLEIYVFTKEIRWVYHEGVQADIFDHLLAAIGWFDLAVFQAPGGRDLRGIVSEVRKT